MNKFFVIIALCCLAVTFADTKIMAQSEKTPYIEYHVTGEAQEKQRDEGMIICNGPAEGFKAHSVGRWIVTIEAEKPGLGTKEASFMIAAPKELTQLKDQDGRTDDRFRGMGTITLEDAGKDQFGLSAVKGHFSANGLKSQGGHTINIEGDLFCAGL